MLMASSSILRHVGVPSLLRWHRRPAISRWSGRGALLPTRPAMGPADRRAHAIAAQGFQPSAEGSIDEDSDEEEWEAYDEDGEPEERPYGPPAVVLAGFYLEELAGVRVMLDQAGGQSIAVVPCTPQLLQQPVEQALQVPEPRWGDPMPPDWVHGGGWGMQRMVLFSGLGLQAQGMVVQLLAASQMGTVVPVAATPQNAGQPLGEVLAQAFKVYRSVGPSGALPEGQQFVDELPPMEQVMAAHRAQQAQQRASSSSSSTGKDYAAEQAQQAQQQGGGFWDPAALADALGAEGAEADPPGSQPKTLEQLLEELGGGLEGWEVEEMGEAELEAAAAEMAAEQQQQQGGNADVDAPVPSETASPPPPPPPPQQQQQQQPPEKGEDGVAVDADAVMAPQPFAAPAPPVAQQAQQPGGDPDWGLRQLASEVLDVQSWVVPEPGAAQGLSGAGPAFQASGGTLRGAGALGLGGSAELAEEGLDLIDRLAEAPVPPSESAPSQVAAAAALGQSRNGSSASDTLAAAAAAAAGAAAQPPLAPPAQQQLASQPAPLQPQALSPGQLLRSRQPGAASPSELLKRGQQPRTLGRGLGFGRQRAAGSGLRSGASGAAGPAPSAAAAAAAAAAASDRSVSGNAGGAASQESAPPAQQQAQQQVQQQAADPPRQVVAAREEQGSSIPLPPAATIVAQGPADSRVGGGSEGGSEGAGGGSGSGEEGPHSEEGVRLHTQQVTSGLSTSTERGSIPGARTMTRAELRAVAEKHGLSYEQLLADALARGIDLPE